MSSADRIGCQLHMYLPSKFFRTWLRTAEPGSPQVFAVSAEKFAEAIDICRAISAEKIPQGGLKHQGYLRLEYDADAGHILLS